MKSGAGLAPLPIAAVEHEHDLVRLLGSVPVLTLHFYLRLSPRHEADARVRAFCDFVTEEIKAFRTLLGWTLGTTDVVAMLDHSVRQSSRPNRVKKQTWP